MPHISVKLYPGREEKVKKELAEKIRDFLVKEMNMEAKYFSVSVEEIRKEDWKEKVVDQIEEKDLYVKADF